MKTITLAVFCLFSMTAISQSNVVDVIIDKRPAKLNTTTGDFKYTGGEMKPSKKSVKSNTRSSIQNGDATIHIVKNEETLYSIAKQYGISMAQIKSVNNLNTNLLRIGQKLKIGYSKTRILQDIATHIVTHGDTLYSIAKQFNISVTQLKALNNLNSNAISIGQELKLK